MSNYKYLRNEKDYYVRMLCEGFKDRCKNSINLDQIRIASGKLQELDRLILPYYEAKYRGNSK